VVAVGGKGVLARRSPAQQLGSSPAFTAAAGKLGNGLRPSFYLDFTQVTKLIESFAGTEPRFQKAKPYLDAFGAIVAGAKDEGSGVTRSRFVVTLRYRSPASRTPAARPPGAPGSSASRRRGRSRASRAWA
jgi:hypothetical protein